MNTTIISAIDSAGEKVCSWRKSNRSVAALRRIMTKLLMSRPDLGDVVIQHNNNYPRQEVRPIRVDGVLCGFYQGSPSRIQPLPKAPIPESMRPLFMRTGAAFESMMDSIKRDLFS